MSNGISDHPLTIKLMLNCIDYHVPFKTLIIHKAQYKHYIKTAKTKLKKIVKLNKE